MDLEKLFEKIPYDRIYPIPTWQRLAGIFGVSVVFMGIFYFLVIKGMDQDISELEKSLTAIQKQVEDNRLHAQKLGKLKEKIAMLEKQMEMASSKLPSKKEIPELLEKVSNIGTQAGLDFITFKPKKEVRKDFYFEVPVSIKVTGRFHNIMMFFDKISHMERIVTMGNIKIKKEKNTSRLALECVASTYRFMDKKEMANNPKKKKGKKK